MGCSSSQPTSNYVWTVAAKPAAVPTPTQAIANVAFRSVSGAAKLKRKAAQTKARIRERGQRGRVDSWSKGRLAVSDFTFDGVLGTGGYSTVHLVHINNSEKYFALKEIDKQEILARGRLQDLHNEYNCVRHIMHPFLAPFHGVCQNSQKLYLAFDFVPGGELFDRIRSQKRLCNDEALFYFCELTVVLLYVHSKGVIFRDLKPENVLIDSSGHVKLIVRCNHAMP